jgi:hypothetical protein
MDERDHQVSIMVDVYHAAQQVLIWLGDTPVDSTGMLNQTRGMADFYRAAHRLAVWLGDTHVDTHVDNPGVIPFVKLGQRLAFGEKRPEHVSYNPSPVRHPLAWLGVQSGHAFLETIASIQKNAPPQWYTRAWVYQEYLQARRLCFCLGPIHVRSSMHHFTFRVNWAARAYGAANWIFDLCFELERIAEARNGDSLHQLAITTMEMQCFDPRDKVYSLLSVASPAKSSLVEPDYRTPTASVFTKATYASIADTGSLRILGEVEAKRGSIPLVKLTHS